MINVLSLFKRIVLISICLLTNYNYSQSLKDYSFENYKTGKVKAKTKAKINFSSNPTATEYRTRIKNEYKNGKINFASYYITVTWGCGSACVSGAMIDTRDGKVYDLPLDESTYFYGCDLDEDFILYKDFSRLFISIYCTEVGIENSDDYYLEKTYFINEWNEKEKKFVLINTLKERRKIENK